MVFFFNPYSGYNGYSFLGHWNPFGIPEQLPDNHTNMEDQASMKKSKKLLLLVEDDPNDILLFEKAIGRSDLEADVLVLRDGEEAIAYLSGKEKSKKPSPPDLILLDLKLPRKSGFEVLEWIKNHPHLQTTPVIILSSSKEAQDLKTAYELGANSYLVKPTGFTALHEMVKDVGGYWLTYNQTLKSA